MLLVSLISVQTALAALGSPQFSVSRQTQTDTVALQREGNRIKVTIAGHPFTTYYFDPAEAKPYFMPLRSARGTVITRSFPIGNTIPPAHLHDRDLEPHQRPMDFGYGDLNGIDFWGEAIYPRWSDDRVFGRTVKVKIEQMKGGEHDGVLQALFNLVVPSGRVIGQEIQSYRFEGGPDLRIIDCEFTLMADRGAPLTFGDTKEGMFALRLTSQLDSPPARMINSQGSVGEKQVWGKRADWVDYDGDVNGERVGVAIFDSPKNFRHPTYWHARGYGLFAANPFGIREFTHDPARDGSWTVRQGHSIEFRYRVFIHHGDYRQARVAEAYQRYAREESSAP